MHAAESISGTKIQIYNGATEIQQNSFNLDADTLEILILDSSGKQTQVWKSSKKTPKSGSKTYHYGISGRVVFYSINFFGSDDS